MELALSYLRSYTYFTSTPILEVDRPLMTFFFVSSAPSSFPRRFSFGIWTSSRFYFSLDVDRERMQNLRVGHYYFGEYLSQGVLKIENKCEIVSAQDMIDQGLCNLRHEFGEFAQWESSRTVPWAKPTVALRQDLYLIECPEITKENSLVAINIARLFGPRW